MFDSLYLAFTNYFLSIGYIGIFVLMLIESSFIPFPSEIVMIPAGYYASLGLMNIYLAIFFGTLGSIAGALINYYLAYKYGRVFLHKNAKYLFTTEEKLEKMEAFFRRHGAFSTFFGRLIPVVRQYISFPAGLSKMNLSLFVFYTGFGALIWMIILAYLGYFLSNNSNLISTYLKEITLFMILIVILVSFIYFTIHYKWYSKYISFKHNKKDL